MQRVATLICAGIICGGCGAKKETAQRNHAANVVAVGMVPLPRSAASAGFEFEIGSVHERYGDLRGAAEHYGKAAAAADAEQRARAHEAFARVREALGDRDSAIEALERARRELGNPSVLPQPAGSRASRVIRPGHEIVANLARLYLAKGLVNQAEKAVDGALAAAFDDWSRERLLRIQVDVLRKAGALKARLAERERALELPKPEEAELRFVAAALESDLSGTPGMATGAAGGAASAQAPAVSGKLVRAYERLHELRPGDLQVRLALQRLLERSGRIDDAVQLALRAAGTTAADCTDGPPGGAPPSSLSGVVEAARIRMRAGQVQLAIVEVGRSAAKARAEGIPGYVALALLYLELGETKLAGKTVDQAMHEARSSRDRRQVELARARILSSTGSTQEVAALYEDWKKSGEPCLVRAAEVESQQRMRSTGPVPLRVMASEMAAMPMPVMPSGIRVIPTAAMAGPAMPPPQMPRAGAVPELAAENALGGGAAH